MTGSTDGPDGALHRVCRRDELEDGDRILVELEGREIAVFCVDGSLYALANYCVHQGGPACEGRISGALFEDDGELVWDREGEFVSCPWHGWEYDITSGKHITHPRYRLPTYEVVVETGDVYISL